METIDPLMAWILGLSLVLITMWIIIIFGRWRRKMRLRLKLQVRFHQHLKHIFMASINSLTITDNLPHTGLISVVDGNGNSYTGTLANVVVAPADPTQDTAIVDPNTPNTIDVQEASPTGGTTVSVTADFTSVGNATPSTSTAQAIPDGTVFPGLTVPGGVTLINKVTASLKLQVAF